MFRIDRRSLFGSTGRSVLYALAGAALFTVVVIGFVEAIQASRIPPPPPAPAFRIAGSTNQPLRYVPPAEIQYPFY